MATATGIDLGGGGIVKNPVKAHGETHYRYAVSGAGNNRNTGTVKNYYGNKVGKVSDFGWAKPSTGGGYSGGSGGSGGASASASSGYSGGGSSGGGYFDMMSEYLNEMRRQREAAINAANAALDQQGKANEQIYQKNMGDVNRSYDDLARRSEVNRYKSRNAQREALANRGALDTGAGRMEALTNAMNYDNALTDIDTNRNQELTSIRNSIADMWAKVNQAKAQNRANGIADYSSALQTYMSNALPWIAGNSGLYNSANNAVQAGQLALQSYIPKIANGGSVAIGNTNSNDALNRLYQALLMGMQG